jgi:exoribonuclease R
MRSIYVKFPQTCLQAIQETIDACDKFTSSHKPFEGFSVDSPQTARIDDIINFEGDGTSQRVTIAIANPGGLIKRNSVLDLEAMARSSANGPSKRLLPIDLESKFGFKVGQPKPGLALALTFDKKGELVQQEALLRAATNRKGISQIDVGKGSCQELPIEELRQLAKQTRYKRRGKSLRATMGVDEIIEEFMILTQNQFAKILHEMEVLTLFQEESRLVTTACRCPRKGVEYATPSTAPLLRYKDWITQRILTAILHGDTSGYQKDELEWICDFHNRMIPLLKSAIFDHDACDTKAYTEHNGKLFETSLNINGIQIKGRAFRENIYSPEGGIEKAKLRLLLNAQRHVVQSQWIGLN